MVSHLTEDVTTTNVRHVHVENLKLSSSNGLRPTASRQTNNALIDLDEFPSRKVSQVDCVACDVESARSKERYRRAFTNNRRNENSRYWRVSLEPLRMWCGQGNVVSLLSVAERAYRMVDNRK